MRRSLLAVTVAVSLAVGAREARADSPYVTLTDDGTIENVKWMTGTDVVTAETKLLQLYAATGQEVPQIMSVWSTFALGGEPYGTFFDPLGPDVKGIGLQGYFPPDGTMVSPHPPLRSILFHNDVTQLPKRAAKQGVPLDGFARYAFLLELSHNWGPEVQVPAPNPSDLIGFPFHWSFWDDAGGSPAGGNQWKDNGDGTFTAIAADPKTISYSMLDLYIMGLATKAEVPPFGVLTNVTPPAGIVDPFSGGSYAAHSFPWFDSTKTFKVTATRRMLTIDDIVTANGVRSPAAGASPTSFKLGIVLLTSSKDTPATVSAARAVFDPIASSLAPSFHDATTQRGTLVVVTHDNPTPGTGGAGPTGTTSSTATTATTGAGGAPPMTGPSKSSGCSCNVDGSGSPGSGTLFLLGLATLAAKRSRRRATRS